MPANPQQTPTTGLLDVVAFCDARGLDYAIRPGAVAWMFCAGRWQQVALAASSTKTAGE